MEVVVINILEIIGTVAWAMAGALTAIEKRMTNFGVIILGVTTAVGGGIIRDILLDINPPQAFTNPTYVIIAVVTCIIMCIPYVSRLFGGYDADPKKKQPIHHKVLNYADSLGLAIFTIIGMDVAYSVSDNSFLIVFVGVATGIAGGVIRDMMANKIPYVFRHRFYASAAIAGALVALVLHELMPHTYALFISVAVIMVIRVIVIEFHLAHPKNKEKAPKE